MAKKVIISSKNPVKIDAVKHSFEEMFPHETFNFEGVSVPSGVSDQPLGEDETFTGAENRATNASKEMPDADYWVGIEGGCEKLHDGMVVYAWMVIHGKYDAEVKVGKARSSTFFLPNEVMKLVDEGLELGDADDKVFKRSNSKQQNGAVGILTGDAITRRDYYVQALKLALIPFLEHNSSLY